MSDRRTFRWATTSARLLAGTLVSVGAVVAVATAVSLPWPTFARSPAEVSVVPAAEASVLVCDGPILAIGRQADDASAVSVVARQALTTGSSADAAPPEERTLEAPALDGEPGPSVLTAPPQDSARVDVAAAGAAYAAADDIAGYAASACRPPLLESWLVGGSATTGAADLVLLSNPGSVPAFVQITAYGSTGEQAPPGGADIVVPAGTQRVIPLAGLQLGEENPVLRVSATGAPVHASLQTSITRTLVPGGVDQVGAIAVPTTSQVIPGVAVTAEPGALGASNAATVVRVLAPSADGEATVTVRAVGDIAPVLEPTTVPLTAGVPTEIDLGGLGIGRYVVEVSADQPVVSAVWQTTGFGRLSDFAWYIPSPTVDLPSLFATPTGPVPVLTLANPGAEAIDVVVSAPDGSDEVVTTVPPAGTATVRIRPRDVYLLDPGGAEVLAAVSLTGDSALAGYPVWPADAASPSIDVYP